MPELGQLRRAAVEGDSAANEQQALGDVLDRAELVRDVEDGHVQLLVEPGEQGGDYFSLMRRNLTQLEAALGCG